MESRSFADLSPVVTYVDVETGAVSHQADLLVIGRVRRVETGRFFTSQDDDESVPETQEVTREDAAWATLHLIIEPEELLGAPGEGEPAPDEVVLGLVVPPEMAGAMQELARLGTVVAPAVATSAVFAYDSDVHAIWGDGELLGVVGEAGAISFPFATEATKARLRLDVATTAQLLAEPASGRTVEVVARGPVIYRADDRASMERDGVPPVQRSD